jgi:hypothetical protein
MKQPIVKNDEEVEKLKEGVSALMPTPPPPPLSISTPKDKPKRGASSSSKTTNETSTAASDGNAFVCAPHESKETRSAKDALLLWCQIKTADYPNVNIRNFTTTWRDGLAFNALIHKQKPELINYTQLNKANASANLNNAFTIADQKLGIPRLLEPEDVNVEYPDDKIIMTYVVANYHYFSKLKVRESV